MPKLLLKFETAVIKEINLDKPVVTVGRKPDNDIVINHPTVSGHHCKIYSAGGSWFVEDLNSTNGTSVNGKRVLKAGLRANDVVAMVKYSLIFSDAAAAPAAPAAESAPKPAEKPEPKAAPAPAPKPEPVLPPQKVIQKACLEVLDNPASSVKEFELTALSTYIGKSSQANIPYKPAGLFGSPDMAALISLRPEGYYLSPVKEGYAKHNGDPLTTKMLLKDDDILEVGATRFRFFLKKT